LLGVDVSGRLQGQTVQAYPCGNFEDSEGAIRIRKWKDRQCHDQNKSTNHDLQTTTEKTRTH